MLLNNYQPLFSGFYHTPHLFSKSVFGLSPFLTLPTKTPVFNKVIKKKLRLGQLVEQFVFEELSENTNIEILATNKQIQNNKITVGELDLLLIKKEQPIHVEIQFKFYLYDPNYGENELEHFIGPNRKDSLVEKINKLKNKQLPLLYSSYTKPFLNEVKLKSEAFIQQVYFKAQLFLPFNKDVVLNHVNQECVYGFYFYYNELNLFKYYKFHIPSKIDWLLDLNPNVDWINSEEALKELTVYKTENYSTLVWLKSPNGELHKCFIVSW